MQGDGLFPEMTVEENLLMGAFLRGSWRERRATLKRVYAELPVVERRATRRRARSRAASAGWSGLGPRDDAARAR